MRIQQWKSFQPQAILPGGEFVRLLQYEQYILSFPRRTAIFNTASMSEPPPYGRFLDNPVDPTRGDESSDWGDKPLYESPADFFRVFPQG